MELKESLQKIATTFQEAYPETAKLAQLGLLISMSTAGKMLLFWPTCFRCFYNICKSVSFGILSDCERGFSCLKRIKTVQRNRLSQEILNSLMMVSIEGPEVEEFPYEKAAKLWASFRNRRIDLGL